MAFLKFLGSWMISFGLVAEMKITLPAWYVVMAIVIFSCCNNSGRFEEKLQVKGGIGFVDIAARADEKLLLV